MSAGSGPPACAETELRFGPNHLFGCLTVPREDEPLRGSCVFVHGLTRGGAQFDRVAAFLGQHGFASLRFDARGRGRSDGEFTLRHLTNDIQEAVLTMRARWPSAPLALIARGEGAYCSVMASWRRQVAAVVFWAPIFYPRTSREIQGHLHQYRQQGFAVLTLPSKEEFWMGKDFFTDLDSSDDAYKYVNAGDRILVIHPGADAVSPLPYVHQFLNKVAGHLVCPATLTVLEASPHPHVDSSFPDSYTTLTLAFLTDTIPAY